MNIYNMDDEVYQDIWLKLIENKNRDMDHTVVDRWLSIYHGLTAISDEVDEHDRYPFMIRDEEKFMFSLLRWL
jgi:hypothetical protein